MGKLKQFLICLNNTTGIYYGGQIVDGRVILELKEAMKMREIRLGIHGNANVHWTEQHSAGQGQTRTVHYNSSEKYLEQKVAIFGRAQGQKDDPVVPPGRYEYPFQFQLPQNLPSSFEGDWGRIRYHLKCTIDKPWKFDHHTKVAFTVLDALDLNKEPNAANGAEAQDEKTLCCCCCKSGPIAAKVRVDRLGFVPGEAVKVQGEVTNHSNRRMKKSRLVFVQVVQFHARGKSRTTVKQLACIEKGEIQPGGSEMYHGDTIPIPPLPPSHLQGCRIMDLEYMIQLVVEPAGPAFDLAVAVTLVIGTIPLQSAVQAYGGQGTSIFAAAATGAVNIRDDDDNQYTMGNMSYTPQYTYYNWGQR